MRFRKQPYTHTGVEDTPAVWRRPSGRAVHKLLLWREIPAGSRVFLVVREAGTSAILAGD